MGETDADDAARVSAWRAQADLIKTRYAGIVREPVPARLSLARLRRLERRWTRQAAAAVVAALLIGGLLGCDPKTVDNALQRVKRKVLSHLQSRRISA